MVKIAGTHFALTSAMEARDLPRLQQEIEGHLLEIWNAIEIRPKRSAPEIVLSS